MKDKKIKIGFDLDGVLIDHKKNRVKAAHFLGYDNVSESMAVREIKTLIPEMDYKKIQEYLYDEATSEADIMVGVKKLWEGLEGICDLYIISRRPKLNSQKEALELLNKEINFSKKNVFFVARDKDKNKIIKKFGIDVFLDDKLSVLEFIETAERFLFDEYRVYKEKKIGGITVVYSHGEFLDLIKAKLAIF